MNFAFHPFCEVHFQGPACQGLHLLVVNLSSYLIALGRTARCCALHRDLDPGSMRRGRNRHHSNTTGNERSYGRIAQGRGRNEVIDVGRPPLWCMPDQPISGRGEEKGRRSSRQTVLDPQYAPEGLPLCHGALCDPWHIHPLSTGVWCDLRVQGASRGKETHERSART